MYQYLNLCIKLKSQKTILVLIIFYLNVSTVCKGNCFSCKSICESNSLFIKTLETELKKLMKTISLYQSLRD